MKMKCNYIVILNNNDKFFYCVEILVIFLRGIKIFLCIVYMIMNVGDKFTEIRQLKMPFHISNNQ